MQILTAVTSSARFKYLAIDILSDHTVTYESNVASYKAPG